MSKRSFLLMIAALLVAGSSMLAQQVLINGAGATFPYPVYSKWFNQYHQRYANVQINYQSLGSGAGIRQVTEGTVDFGASDGPMNEDQLKQFQAKRGSQILHFPTVMGADVMAYNLPGVSGALNFTPEAIAGIFLGKITKWNDPELTKANPGVKLPGSDIVVVHRSDGSGTTYVLVDYLSKVSQEWKTKVGRGTSVNWPVGLGGKGNEGVAGLVKQTPNSIGYVELIYAIQNKMAYGNVKNAAGKFVRPSTASVTAAAGGHPEGNARGFPGFHHQRSGKGILPDLEFHLAADPGQDPGPGARRKQLWISCSGCLRDDAQAMAEGSGLCPLPKAVVAKEVKAIAKIQ